MICLKHNKSNWKKSSDGIEEKPAMSEGETAEDHDISEQEEAPSLSPATQNVIDYEAENNNSKQSVLSPEETDNQKQPVLSAKEANDTFSKTKEKLPAREISFIQNKRL